MCKFPLAPDSKFPLASATLPYSKFPLASAKLSYSKFPLASAKLPYSKFPLASVKLSYSKGNSPRNIFLKEDGPGSPRAHSSDAPASPSPR